MRRKETLDQNPAEAIQGGYITGYGGQNKPVTGSRTRWDAFGEVNIPIVKTLEADVAVRYDHYSDFGGTTNPEVQPALAADQVAAGARIVWHGLPGAGAVRALLGANVWRVAGGPYRSDPLPRHA